MVEEKNVEAAMVKFGQKLSDYMTSYRIAQDKEALKRPLFGASYDLAHALRASIESQWGSEK